MMIHAIVLLLCVTTVAQKRKVAVFNPAGDVENYLKEVVREEISSIVVSIIGYTVLERQSIDKVLEENKFQMGGLVDDSQISEIGKLMGANSVFVTNITPIENGNIYISCKMIDVLTARIEIQKTGQCSKKTTELVNTIQKMVKEMFSNTLRTTETTKKGDKQGSTTPSSELFTRSSKVIMFDNELARDKKLEKKEVQERMGKVNVRALQLYNNGLSKNKKGYILIGCSVAPFALGIMSVSCAKPFATTPTGWSGGTQDAITATGAVLLAGGVALLIPGVVFTVQGKNHIRDAVNMYNKSSGTLPSTEFKFGITSSGVGMALKF